ncbi:VWA domain-containing protein [Mycolicibacterium setense]|uniref:VWA domain-containing protein n=1 Tax=Mycolicibacterium setense TaxID=431269 RepID=UPI000574097F|nr:VWA domain-containing protein [Mycolicibacterium setense]KHO25855.1 hypothetical protein QQ25_00095 [Mycolicibacterium setense]MCV7110423.1 VWA domain-containing protein [Mycolicibacterium setense]
MRLEPLVPPLLLAALAVALVAARTVTFRQSRSGGRPARRRWWALTAAGVLLLVAGLGPVAGAATDTVARPAGDREPSIFLILDRSPEMSERDVGDRSRMTAAHADIMALIERYPRARFALISFSGRPSVDWPLSADTWSLGPVVTALDPYPVASDTNVGAAATVLRYQLITAVQQFPRAENLVFYLGAGATESEAPQREFQLPENSVDGGAVLGYGSAGAQALRGVAGQIGVPFVSRTDATPLDAALPGDGAPGQRPGPAVDRSVVELYWGFAAAAALLILVEFYLVLREFRRMQPIDVGPGS